MEHDPALALLPLLVPLLLLEIGLKIAALVSLSRASRVRFGNKALWAALIVLVGLMGSVLWFFVGRDERPEAQG